MGIQENVQLVKNGYAAFARRDIQGLLALFAEDIEWVIPGAGLPLSGTYRGHAGVASFFQKLSCRLGNIWRSSLANSWRKATAFWWSVGSARK